MAINKKKYNNANQVDSNKKIITYATVIMALVAVLTFIVNIYNPPSQSINIDLNPTSNSTSPPINIKPPAITHAPVTPAVPSKTNTKPNTKTNPFVNLSVLPTNRVVAVAFQGDPRIASIIIKKLPHPVVLSLFTSAFYDEGIFKQAFLGNASKFRSLGLENKVDNIFLIDIGAIKYINHKEYEDSIQAKTSFNFLKIDPLTGAILNSKHINLEGIAFTTDEAFNNLTRDIEHKLTIN